MRNAKRGDIVTCERVGGGNFRVINVFNHGVSVEVQIQSVGRPSGIHTVYEHHCTKNLKATMDAHKNATSKILSKPRRY